MDSDNDGENICYEVISNCSLPEVTLLILTLAEKEIKAAFEGLGESTDTNKSLSVDVK
jgi:hypothetical protein